MRITNHLSFLNYNSLNYSNLCMQYTYDTNCYNFRNVFKLFSLHLDTISFTFYGHDRYLIFFSDVDKTHEFH